MYDRDYFRHWRRERMFNKGDFKYLILELLAQKPRHGYEIIRELEERSHGFYSPSPGLVYPTLQYLEEMGYVSPKEQDGKKVYTITDEGKTYLEGQRSATGDTSFWGWPGFEDRHGRRNRDVWGHEFREQFHDVMREIADLGRLVGRRARAMNGEKMRRIGEILKRAYAEIETIIKEEPKSAV
jgi:DNA-binding PadR family transcriptional regulator